MTEIKFIFLHGWGGSAESLKPLAESIREKFSGDEISAKTQIIELPGFGNTKLEEVMTLDDYCEYVFDRINTEGGNALDNNTVLVGHSFGGKIIIKLAAEGRLGEANIVLINSSGLHPRNSLKKTVFKIITLPYAPVRAILNAVGLTRIEKLLQKAFYKFVVRTRDYEKLNNPIIKETFKKIIDTHIDEFTISAINNKTLILWGRQDGVTPLWMGERLNELISGSKLEVVDGATHSLPLKMPDVCAEKVQKWY